MMTQRYWITPGQWESSGEFVFTRVPEGLAMVAQMLGLSYLTEELSLSAEEAIKVRKSNACLMAEAPTMYNLLDKAFCILRKNTANDEICREIGECLSRAEGAPVQIEKRECR